MVMGTVTKLVLLAVMAGLIAAVVVWDKASTTGAPTAASGREGSGIVKTLQEVKQQASETIGNLDIKQRAEKTFGKLEIKRRASEMFESLEKAVENVSGKDVSSPERREASRRASPSGPGTEHVVRKGDTLWSIAKQYYGSGTQAGRIEKANRDRIGNSRQLRIGMHLRIPDVSGKPPPEQVHETRNDAAPREAASSREGPRTYVVRKGDSLWRIADRELGDGTKWKALYEANRDLLVKPSDLRPGLEIRLPEGGR